MEAIIETSGSQFKVKKGQKFEVNLLQADEGSNVEFDCLAVLGDKAQFGAPVVNGAKVVTKVLGHKRGDKVVIYKAKRRKGYHKKQGHRQELTLLEVVDIKA
ncbi:MAG: 50S ribosomal protein L21 [Deltaproteobacteria bacterium]|nr:50S ribosomal protein L21 [Deltaproteobacteria bacterium]